MAALANITWWCNLCGGALMLEAEFVKNEVHDDDMTVTVTLRTTKKGTAAAYEHMTEQHPEVAV